MLVKYQEHTLVLLVIWDTLALVPTCGYRTIPAPNSTPGTERHICEQRIDTHTYSTKEQKTEQQTPSRITGHRTMRKYKTATLHHRQSKRRDRDNIIYAPEGGREEEKSAMPRGEKTTTPSRQKGRASNTISITSAQVMIALLDDFLGNATRNFPSLQLLLCRVSQCLTIESLLVKFGGEVSVVVLANAINSVQPRLHCEPILATHLLHFLHTLVVHKKRKYQLLTGRCDWSWRNMLYPS